MAGILIIEPDVSYGAMLHQYLVDQGWKAEWVKDARAGIQQCQKTRAEVVLMELDTPGLDGFELIASLRSLSHRPAIVLSTVTPRASSWTKESLEELGVAAHIVRPARLENIASTLEVVLGTRQRPSLISFFGQGFGS